MLMLKNVRLSFPSLFKASSFQDQGEPKFSATFLIEKGSEAHKAVEAEIKRVASAAWGEKAKGIVERQNASQRKLLKDGDTVDGETQDGERKNGYAGHMAIKGSSKNAPLVIGRQRQPITEESGIIYGGCIVNAQVDIWAQDNQFGKFLNCKLLAVQFWADGEAFGTAARADASAFDAEEAPAAFDAPADDIPW